jgi:glutamate--cysteine ligase
MTAEPKSVLLSDRAQLVSYLEAGSKPVDAWRIGTEHEKFGYRISDLKSLPYDGPDGIRAMLDGLTRFGWQPVMEGDNVIALAMNGASVSLEPGGQFELSGAPLKTLHETCDEVNTHLNQVREVAGDLGVAFLGLGFHPILRRKDAPIMPKQRYNIMRAYMPTRGTLGLDMMLRSCTVQVNLDHGSEADMVKKMRVGLALQPVATALFANSPFTEGKPNGYLSYRSQLWTDTDPDRCGMLPFVFDDGFGFEAYADYALDVPMYFVYRDGNYIDASGQSFRDFLAGQLPALPGEIPTLKDWDDHLTTIFPEVRLKRFIEMRGADGGPWNRLCALPAFWIGLTYDNAVLDAAWDMVKDWTDADRQRMRDTVPRLGFKTEMPGGRSMLDFAGEVVTIARAGLRSRAALDRSGNDESGFLVPLKESVDKGQTPAEELLDLYHGRWQGSVEPVFEEFHY